MLKNYCKIAIRNLWRKKTFSFINITGLAVGMAACFLIFLYVHFELSYDGFHSKADRTYRVVGDLVSSAETLHWYPTPGPLARTLKREFPEVQETVRVTQANLLVRKGNFKFQERHSLWVDSTFFSVFDFPLKYGDPGTALKEPNSVVFTESAAHKYFGNTNPVGQPLLLSGWGIPVRVTGVMKDFPENSHIRADMLVSMRTYITNNGAWIDDSWSNFDASTYLVLSPGAHPAALQSRIPAVLHQYADRQLKESNMQYSAKLEPLKDVYLRSPYGARVKGNLDNVYIFSLIAVFVLLIACVNFVNLTTARSVERAKEVGIRKCAGAVKHQLLGQFLVESALVALLAYLLALVLCQVFLPLFNTLSGKTISRGIFENPYYPLWLLGLTIGIGLLAGIYPAFVLSSFRPIVVLKGRFATGNKGILLRKVLVVTQFTICIALIAGTLVVYSQLDFMRSRPLGFNKEQMLVIPNEGDPGTVNFKKELAGLPAVRAASISSAVPGRDYNPDSDMWWVGITNGKGERQRINIDFYRVDEDFLQTYQIKVLAGRAFSKDFPADSVSGVILNRSAVEKLGYSSCQAAIGQSFESDGPARKVVGVVEDFHFHSLREVVQPLCLVTGLGYWEYISLKVAAANLPATIRSLQTKWEQTIPNRPFSYFFLDEDYNSQYRSEDRFGGLFFYFSILAIFISSLGLLGLASYNTLQRTQEIGIRKILGASVASIVGLLSRDFVQLVVISFLIACPLAWFAMHKWLEGFALRVPLGWGIFALAGAGALLVAVGTISFQSVKAALANPVKSLRTE